MSFTSNRAIHSKGDLIARVRAYCDDAARNPAATGSDLAAILEACARDYRDTRDGVIEVHSGPSRRGRR